MTEHVLRKNKIEQLEKVLIDLWEAMSPNLKAKKCLWDKFSYIQTKARLINLKIEGDLKNGTR